VKLKIGPDNVITIKYVKKIRPKLVGHYNGVKKLIRIATTQSKKDQHFTLLHELIHAIDDEHDIQLTEDQVLKLEEGLMLLCDYNPDFSLMPK